MTLEDIAREIHKTASELDNAAKEKNWQLVRELSQELTQRAQHLNYTITKQLAVK